MYKAVSKALSDTVVQRLKTPLIATFLFSWLVVNHSIVLQFTFETLPNKVELAKNLEVDWWYGFWLPAIVSLAYIVVIPALQLGLDFLVLKTLGELRKEHDVQVARNTAQSTSEYQSKLLDKQMENWEKEKADLNDEIDDLNRQIGELVDQLQHSNTQKGFAGVYQDVVSESVKQAIDSLERPQLTAGSDYEDQRTCEEICNDAIEILKQIPVKDEEGIPF